jgi:site-specific DNA recombinase
MYAGKLDGLMDTAFFEKAPNQWREKQRPPAKQEPREKRRLLNFVLPNGTWESGEVVAAFHQPFDLPAETATAASRAQTAGAAKLPENEIWLGNLDSNQD